MVDRYVPSREENEKFLAEAEQARAEAEHARQEARKTAAEARQGEIDLGAIGSYGEVEDKLKWIERIQERLTRR